MISVFDEDGVLNYGDNIVIIRNPSIVNNLYRENSTIEDYSRNLCLYAQVMDIYIEFFAKYWYKDNTAKTNQMMVQELERVGILGPNRIWPGLTAEEHNPLGEYVLTLDFPIKDSEMKSFFKRVCCGDLEFLCRYPKNGTCAWELLKGTTD